MRQALHQSMQHYFRTANLAGVGYTRNSIWMICSLGNIERAKIRQLSLRLDLPVL